MSIHIPWARLQVAHAPHAVNLGMQFCSDQLMRAYASVSEFQASSRLSACHL
jgi:hypothetical protein